MLSSFSLEVFSPKTQAATARLQTMATALAPFGPKFTSVTVGTGNGDPSLTDETLSLLNRHAIGQRAAHIAAGPYNMADLERRADAHLARGVTQAVAIRGDDGGQATVPVVELVGMLSDKGFDVCVAAYPETHPRAASEQACLNALKAKQDAGATTAITQFFFHADTFFRFRDRAVQAGITLDLIPGILPVVNWEATQRMAAQCGTQMDPDLAEAFARAQREGRADLMATAQGTELCYKLIEGGVDHLHFYTMNRAHPVADILLALGLTPSTALREVA